MKTSIPYREVADALESVLREANCVFHRSSSRNFLEFHVQEPTEIIFRVIHLEERVYPSIIFGFLLPSRQGECTDLEIITRESEGSKDLASRLISELVKRLPRKPWEGLGLIESRTSKALWEEWIRDK